eukprot:1939173-Amphidinium_carterae.1
MQQMCDRHGQHWLPTRRFCIQQGVKLVKLPGGLTTTEPKFRLIDDFSESCINKTAVLRETVPPEGVDDIALLCKVWLSGVRGDE